MAANKSIIDVYWPLVYFLISLLVVVLNFEVVSMQ
jgi:hypothetical protein